MRRTATKIVMKMKRVVKKFHLPGSNLMSLQRERRQNNKTVMRKWMMQRKMEILRKKRYLLVIYLFKLQRIL